MEGAMDDLSDLDKVVLKLQEQHSRNQAFLHQLAMLNKQIVAMKNPHKNTWKLFTYSSEGGGEIQVTLEKQIAAQVLDIVRPDLARQFREVHDKLEANAGTK